MLVALALAALQATAAPLGPLGPQKAVVWQCTLRGPAGEPHEMSGRFSALGEGAYGSTALISVTVITDTTGLLIGPHPAVGRYAIPKGFSFSAVRGEVVTALSMAYFGQGDGATVTVTQTDSATHAPSYHRAVGIGYCQTSEEG